MTVYFDKLLVKGKPVPRRLSKPFEQYEGDIVWVIREKVIPETVVAWLEARTDGDIFVHNYKCDIVWQTPPAHRPDPLWFGVEFTSEAAKAAFETEFSEGLARNSVTVDAEVPVDRPTEPHPTFGEGFYISYERGAKPRVFYQAKRGINPPKQGNNNV